MYYVRISLEKRRLLGSIIPVFSYRRDTDDRTRILSEIYKARTGGHGPKLQQGKFSLDIRKKTTHHNKNC